MKQIIYDGANIDVQDGPDGQKVLVITEQIPPSGVAHLFPLPEQIADAIGSKLKGQEPVVVPPKPQLLVPGGKR